ncbi:3895_t:CDS:2, partial [Gigaspora rosea]
VEGAADFIEWEAAGNKKSTNRIDDVINLTAKGQDYVQEIQIGVKKDKLCWSWIMFCSGDGDNCQHKCGGIGKCLPSCSNYGLRNNLRNGNDMHRCSVRVHSFSRLSYLNSSHPLRIKIEGTHLPSNILNAVVPKISRINLTREVQDKIIISRHADHRTTKGIKGKLLVSLNGASEEELNNALLNSREICNNIKLKRFITHEDKRLKDNSGPWTILNYLIEEDLKSKGYILYYQQPDLSEPEDSPEHYYQLTVSDEFWLRNGRKFGQFYIGIDGKYDLNIDHAPVLTMVVENNTGHGTPLASNIPCADLTCEHPWHYEDLPNQKGFQRIRDCASNQPWNPTAMIDKHRLTKRGVDGIIRGTILCWFHIMQTFGENLKQWNIPHSLRSDNNWICDEWRMQFIDAGRLPISSQNPITTNNYTERMNRTIESQLTEKQTVVTFIERLYGIKLLCENLCSEGTNKSVYEAGLVTLLNAQSIEQPMMKQLVKDYEVELRDGFYIMNIITGRCPLCLDYIWNGPFYDVYKHHHAAQIFLQGNCSKIIQETKKKF